MLRVIQAEVDALQADVARKAPGTADALRARLVTLQRMFTATLEE